MAGARHDRRRERPRRPAFVEHLGRAPLSEDGAPPETVRGTDGPPSRPAADASAPPAPAPASTDDRSALNAAAPDVDLPDRAPSPGVPERPPPVVIQADDVNRPQTSAAPERSIRAALPRRTPPERPASAIWLIVALVVGLAVGAVAGTVAALVLVG